MGLIKDFIGYRNMLTEQRNMQSIQNQFKAFTVYAPSFKTYSEGVYEMDVTRSSIKSIADHVSKASPVILGDKLKDLEYVLKHKPNGLMTGKQFLQKVTTILVAENTCFIIPLYEDLATKRIIGFHPVSSIGSKIFRFNDRDWLEYRVQVGAEIQKNQIPLEEVGILRDHYYRDDYYGESNEALNPTLEVLSVQNQGIVEGVKQSATIRFMMKLSAVLSTPAKYKDVRDKLNQLNLSSDNNNGIFLYDNQFENATPIESKPFTIDSDQSNGIRNVVFNYFGTNEKIIQNKFTEEEFNAFYEGRIEPILIQISEVITNMIFTKEDVQKKSMVIYESSRLQYASNKTKLEFVTAFTDRGILTINQGLSVFNLPPVNDGDKRYIRREYVEVGKLDKKEDPND